MLVQDGGMLDQCITRLVTSSSSAIPVCEMLILVRDMLASDRRYHGDARHAIRAATTEGFSRWARIDMNSRGMRKARAVQSGFKELPIAMGQSRDDNAMNPSRISRRF